MIGFDLKMFGVEAIRFRLHITESEQTDCKNGDEASHVEFSFLSEYKLTLRVLDFDGCSHEIKIGCLLSKKVHTEAPSGIECATTGNCLRILPKQCNSSTITSGAWISPLAVISERRSLLVAGSIRSDAKVSQDTMV